MANGVPVEWSTLSTHRLAGGDLESLVDGLIFAKERSLEMSIQCACARELYARVKHRVSLRDSLVPMAEAGIRDIDREPL